MDAKVHRQPVRPVIEWNTKAADAQRPWLVPALSAATACRGQEYPYTAARDGTVEYNEVSDPSCALFAQDDLPAALSEGKENVAEKTLSV